jgi:uncharacterized protein YfaS (alpha-2-macroglobulin family)/tetratricopeptide (TPR) repeat protein
MPIRHLRIQHLLVGLALASLAGLLAAASTTSQSTGTAPELLQRGTKLFEEQRYAEALPLLERAGKVDPGYETRAVGFYRHTCALRLAGMQQDQQQARLEGIALQAMASEELDDWGARAVRELVRARVEAGPELQRLFGLALERWESLPDIPLATREYLELMDALLLPSGTVRPFEWSSGPNVAAPVERMWQNLFNAKAPRERLLALAERILADENAYRFGETRERVGRDVLALDPPGPLAASAHWQLGQLAENRGLFREAEEQYRAAVAAAPAKDSGAVQQAAQRLASLTAPSATVQGSDLYRPGSYHAVQVSWRNLLGWTLEVRQLDPVRDLDLPATSTPGARGLSGYFREGAGKLILTRAYDDLQEQRARGQQPPAVTSEQGERGKRGEKGAQDAQGAQRPQGGNRGTAAAEQDGGNAGPDTALADTAAFAPRAPQPHVPRSKIMSLDPLPAGLYRVTVTMRPAETAKAGKRPANPNEAAGRVLQDGEAPAELLFQVTDLGLTQQAIGGGQQELWLVEMQAGQPITGAQLLIARAQIRDDASRRNLAWSTTKVTTNGDGLAHIATVQTNGYLSLAIGVVKGHPVLMNLGPGSWDRPEHEEAWRSYVLSDRPLYRPGETVHLQAFVRRQEAAERVNVAPAGESIVVVIRAADGSEVLRQELKLDDNGALELTHVLDEHPALGMYQVQLQKPAEDGQGRWIGGGGFQVDEYRLPEFTVTAQLDASRRYVLGDTLRVEVAAEYLFGGPVSGEAEVVVTRSPRWLSWRPWSRFGWLRENGLSDRFDAGIGRSAAPWQHGGGDEVLRVSQPLGRDGRLTVLIPTPADENDSQDWTYSVEARVTDASRREERGSATVPITRQEIYAYLCPQRYVVAPGDEAQVRLHVQDAQERPVVQAGRTTLWRQEQVQRKRGEDARLAETEPRQILARLVRTDEHGEALLTFKPERPGYYELRYETRDARGNAIEAQAVVWCAGPDTHAVVHGAGALQLIAEQDEFATQDVARVLLVSDTPGALVYLSRYFGLQVETQVLRMEGTVKLLEIPLDDFHRPYFFLQAATARDFRLQQATARIVAPLGKRALDVAVEFERESYKPGEKAWLRVRTKDAQGKAVRAPVTLAVVDEAVLAILPRDLADPNQAFNSFPTRTPSDLQISAAQFGGFAWIEEKPDEQEWPPSGRRRDAEAKDRALGKSEFRAPGLGATVRELDEASAAGRSAQAEGMVSAKMSAVADNAMPAPAAPSQGRPGAGGPAAAPVTLRTDFRTTALWRTAVWTDVDGVARVEVPLAESLTRWQALGVAITPDTRAGTGEGSARTRKDVMVRLNHPRVFREKDRFLFAATVHNETGRDLRARVSMAAAPLTVEGGEQQIVIKAHGQAQVQWWASVAANSAGAKVVRDSAAARLRVIPGEALVRVTALTEVDSDAFERPVQLLPHGTTLRVVAAGEARPGETQLSVVLPTDRLTGVESATVTLSPSVLSACIDALGYLAEYPYGCTEQTLSRFVPAAAVRAVTQALGVSSKRFDGKLDDKVREGLRRIADFQHGDGGWGWWKEDVSDAYMTAHVLVALSNAARHGVAVDRGLLQRGREALRGMLARPGLAADHRAYALYALTAADGTQDGGAQGSGGRKSGGQSNDAQRGSTQHDAGYALEDDAMRASATRLFTDRDQLSDYARALLATYMARTGHTDQGELLLRHLENTIQRNPAYGTAHWGKLRNYWWCGEGAVETTAFAVEAYGALEPDHENRRAAVRWLVVNREGNRWQSTRATAHTIYALTDYARDAGELDARYTLVATAGPAAARTEIARIDVSRKTLLDAGGEFTLPTRLLRDGENVVRLHLEGKGTCYATVSVDTWTAAENPEPTEHYLAVRREIVRLRPQRTLGGSILQIEEPLRDGDSVASGDRLRVRLWLTAHNELEYIAIEDPRPAGCEPVDQLSGWFAGSGDVIPLARAGKGGFGAPNPPSPVSGRREIRDELSAFFVSSLPQGEHVLAYELRAESPGTYHVMPTRAFAMYVPDVNGSSQEQRVEITARPAAELSSAAERSK